MNTTPDNVNLPERLRQPVIRMEVLLFPTELYALEGKLLEVLMQLDANNPEKIEVAEGLFMLNAAIRRTIKAINSACDKVDAQ